jgi:hypothetical protein
MRFEDFAFGRIRVDGAVYDHDLEIDHGKIHKRKKQPSKKYRESFGHTPLSAEEKIPWNCGQTISELFCFVSLLCLTLRCAPTLNAYNRE